MNKSLWTAVRLTAVCALLTGCAAAMQPGPSCDEMNRPDVSVRPDETRPQALRFGLAGGAKSWGPTKAVVYVVVDSSGRVKSDSTVVCGTSRALVISQIRKSARTMSFRPATRNGVPVRSVYGYFLYFNREPDPIEVRNRELRDRRASSFPGS